MTQVVIRVTNGWHVPGITEDGRDFVPIGPTFKTPGEAVHFADLFDQLRADAEAARAAYRLTDTVSRSAPKSDTLGKAAEDFVAVQDATGRYPVDVLPPLPAVAVSPAAAAGSHDPDTLGL